MANITILRAYFGDCTISRVITAGGFKCLGLELPWLGNQPRISCIPEGEYPYRVALSPRSGKNVIWIDKVPERSAIQIHPGNYTSQIQGCLLPGRAVTDLNNDGVLDITASGETMQLLLDSIPTSGTIRFIAAQKPVGVYR
jgi:hypothetical protein